MTSSSVGNKICVDLQSELKALCTDVSSGCDTAVQYTLIISTALMISTFTIGTVYILDATTGFVKLIYDISYKCLYPKKIKNQLENAAPIKEAKTGGKLWKNFIKSAKKLAIGSLPILFGIIFYKLNELVAGDVCIDIGYGCTNLTAKLITSCDRIDTSIITTFNNTIQDYIPR